MMAKLISKVQKGSKGHYYLQKGLALFWKSSKSKNLKMDKLLQIGMCMKFNAPKTSLFLFWLHLD